MNVLDVSFNTTYSSDALSKDVLSEISCTSSAIVCYDKQHNGSNFERETKCSSPIEVDSTKRM